MKVLHVYKTYYPDPIGGLQEAIRQICLSTKNLGAEVRIFTLSPNPSPEKVNIDDIEIFRYKSWFAPGNNDMGLLKSYQAFKKHVEWADIVHYHFPWPFADLLHILVNNKKPSIMTYHSDVIDKGFLEVIYNPLMKKMLSSMKAVVATSPKYTESSNVLKSYVDPDALEVISYGLDEESYLPYIEESKGIDIKDRFGLEKDSYFLFIGVLRKYKGLDYLIDASSDTDSEIVIAGSGPLQQYYEERSIDKKNISLVGQISNAEKMALIKNCKGLILPSHMRSEAFGIVLIEASMQNKPLISCEIGTGTSYGNKNGVTGLVVESENPKELSDAMNSLSNDKDLSKKMGNNARERYETLFQPKQVGEKYFSLYKRILESD